MSYDEVFQHVLEDEVFQLVEDEVLKNEIVHSYQNYGVIETVKYGLCKAIKNGYNHFMISFIDSYNNASLLKTRIVDSNNYNNIIVDSNEFTEILEKYYYGISPATNFEVGTALLDTINALFIKCVDYQIDYYNF